MFDFALLVRHNKRFPFNFDKHMVILHYFPVKIPNIPQFKLLICEDFLLFLPYLMIFKIFIAYRLLAG